MSYVIAVIRLPLVVHSNGTFTSLSDNIDFEFLPVETLPPKKENRIVLASLELDEILRVFVNKDIPIIIPESIPSNAVSSYVIIPERVPQRGFPFGVPYTKNKHIRNKNTTFKNNIGNTHNYSKKNYSSF